MTLEQLRIFVAVAEREHVTQGARDLNLTQSASSAAIAVLEARYATKLFDRIGRRIILTDAGRVFLEEARAVLARARSAEAVLTDFAEMKAGTLNVAASQTVANYWFSAFLHQFRCAFPVIVTNIVIGNTQTAAARVIDGVADLGIVEGQVDDPVLSVTPIAEDEMVLVVGKSHKWAKRKAVDLKEFDQTEWVLREQGSGTRAAFEAAIASAGIQKKEIRTALELPSNEAVRAAVEIGAGAGVMSKLVVDRSIQAGVLVSPKAALPNRQFFLLKHEQRHTTRIALEFINCLSG